MPLWGSEQYYKHFEDMTDKEKEEVANTYGEGVFSSGAPSIAWLAEAVKEQEKREKEEARLYEERYDYLDDVDDEVDDVYDKDFVNALNFDEEFRALFDREDESLYTSDGEYHLTHDRSSHYSSQYSNNNTNNSENTRTIDVPYKRRFGDSIHLIHIIIYSILVPNIPYLLFKFAELLNNWRFLQSAEDMYVTLKYSLYYQHFYAISLMVFIMIYVDNRTKRYLDQKMAVNRTNEFADK